MQFRRAHEQMILGLDQGLFTGAVLRVSLHGEMLFQECYGSLGGAGTPPVTPRVLFDLASLTKVLATTPCWMVMAKRHADILDRPLSVWFADVPPDKQAITPRQLLAHSSGLPPWRPYYLYSIPSLGQLVREKIFSEALQYPTGTECVYSDLGFMLLARIAQLESGKPLDLNVKEAIYEPLGLADDLLFRPLDDVDRTACTRAGEHPGSVNDLNSRSLGGVAGHAGLFGTADGAARIGEEILKGLKSRGGLFDPVVTETFCRRANLVPGCTRALGFDTPSEEASSSGGFFSAESIGHTGFTGTSLWIDPTRELVVVLLTNRVFMGESDMRIKEFRPLIHDAILQALI